MLGGLDDRVAVVHHPNPNLLVCWVLGKEGEIPPVAAGALKRDHIGLELPQIGEGTLVARWFPIDALLIGIAPAGVDPDLGVNPDELTIKRLGEKLEVGVGAVRPCGAPVVRWFFDLDEGTASGGELPQLGVEDVAEIVNELLLVPIVLVPEHAREGGGADSPELHGAV